MATDPTKLKTVKEINRNDILLSVGRQANSNVLCLGSSDANVYQLDVMAEKPEPKPFTGHSSYITGVVCLGDQVVSASYDGTLIWWNPQSGEKIRQQDAHQRWIRDLAVSVDGKLLVSVADDMVCRVWDAQTGSLKHELRGHEAKTPDHFPSMLYACAISADGARIASGDRVGHVVIWDAASGQQLKTLEAPLMYTWDPTARIHSIGGIRSLAFSPDGKQLAVGGMGKVGNIDHLEGKARIEIFDCEKAEQIQLHESNDLKGLVERLIYARAGNWLLATGGDNGGFVIFLDPATGQVIKQEKAPTHIHDAIVNEADDTIYVVAHNKILVWSLTG